MDERNHSFGYWLRRRRKALDLTQGALAQKVCCSQAAIKKIEAEERRPSKALAQRLAEHLLVPVPERAAFLAAARRPQLTDRLDLDTLPIEAVGAATARNKLARGGDEKLPFVGRSNEYGQFVGLIARLATGNGHVVLLQGEAGIGKSRLMYETAAYAQQQAVPVLVTNCYEIERAIAYQPIIDLATQACEAVSEPRLRAIAPILLAEIAALLPAMATRLFDPSCLSADFPVARQARLFHALVELFDALAQNRQLVVIADNIQWADDASLRFLHFLGRQTVRRPMLLICAYRDEELDSTNSLISMVESLGREHHTRQITLPRLKPCDTQTLLEKLNHPKLAAPDFAVRLHRESEGNPLFLWSIMHSLSEGACTIDEVLSPLLPGALRDSVRSRLARVAHEDRPLLDMAAVIGRHFDFETLLTLTRAPAEDVLQTMESLVKRRLLREDQDGAFYDFSHDKIREVVYGDIGAARRVVLHRVVAELLEQHEQSDAHERDAHLAEHYERGKVWPKALLYLGLAADRSQKLLHGD